MYFSFVFHKKVQNVWRRNNVFPFFLVMYVWGGNKQFPNCLEETNINIVIADVNKRDGFNRLVCDLDTRKMSVYKWL